MCGIHDCVESGIFLCKLLAPSSSSSSSTSFSSSSSSSSSSYSSSYSSSCSPSAYSSSFSSSLFHSKNTNAYGDKRHMMQDRRPGPIVTRHQVVRAHAKYQQQCQRSNLRCQPFKPWVGAEKALVQCMTGNNQLSSQRRTEAQTYTCARTRASVAQT